MVAKVFGKTKLGASITHYAFRQQHHCERHINVKLSKSSLGLWKLEEMRGSKDQLAKKHFMGICLCSLCELRSWDFGVWELLFTRVSLCMQKRERNTVDSQKFLRTKLTVFGFITSDITLSCSIKDRLDSKQHFELFRSYSIFRLFTVSHSKSLHWQMYGELYYLEILSKSFHDLLWLEIEVKIV